ncbi:MAG: two-component system, chemotaxis family, sensor kinase CheA [Thermoanaerobaculia bacterium]|jgi:two-component system chemotaxis sensor kinase CheA|nr:two-component system, chemotaxis family, sensor kinase CheA [Thermoanaerobaculia bacterium]
MTEFTISDADRLQLIDAFVAESDDVLDEIEQLLLRLEQSPNEDQLLHEIFRGVHTLKGNAACLQFDDLTRFAHVVEELLDGMREGHVAATAAHISELLDAVDALRDIAARSVHGNGALSDRQETLLLQIQARAEISGVPLTAAGNMTAGPTLRGTRSSRTLRVGIDKLDRMLNLAGEIGTVRSTVRQLVEVSGSDEKTLDAVRELDRLSFDLQEAIMNVRLVPAGPALGHFHRIVRDLAASQEKRVMLSIEGGDVEVDTTVIEQLKDPITHMIRNAIGHGIERPAIRNAKGKSPAGLIRIALANVYGGIAIRFSDDGAGLNETAIAERAHALGLDTELSRQELWDLTLRPGFSTAAEVTDLSGRGVGMDVVRRNIDALRGTMSIHSDAGVGTAIEIRLPLTVTVIEGFAVGVADETYVIPIESVIECVEMPETGSDATGIIDLRGEPLPFLRIQRLFGLKSSAHVRENVVVVEDGDRRTGIVVDALFGSSQVVMKPMGRFLRQVPGVAGSSILGNGRIALILDVPEIITQARDTSSQGKISQ